MGDFVPEFNPGWRSCIMGVWVGWCKGQGATAQDGAYGRGPA